MWPFTGDFQPFDALLSSRFSPPQSIFCHFGWHLSQQPAPHPQYPQNPQHIHSNIRRWKKRLLTNINLMHCQRFPSTSNMISSIFVTLIDGPKALYQKWFFGFPLATPTYLAPPFRCPQKSHWLMCKQNYSAAYFQASALKQSFCLSTEFYFYIFKWFVSILTDHRSLRCNRKYMWVVKKWQSCL